MSNILTNNINARSGNTITIGKAGDTVAIAGTLSYEDVSSVDSVGIITANAGIDISNTIVANNDSTIRYDDDTLHVKVDANNVRGSSTFKLDVDDTTAITIDDNRRIGIGTDNPDELLEVGDGTVSGALKVSGQSSSVTSDGFTVDWESSSNSTRFFSEPSSGGSSAIRFLSLSPQDIISLSRFLTENGHNFCVKISRDFNMICRLLLANNLKDYCGFVKV